VVKNTGDGFLAEFASVVDAVRCAVEVQRGPGAFSAEAKVAKTLTAVTAPEPAAVPGTAAHLGRGISERSQVLVLCRQS
jgi:hypothetical protein